MICRSPRHGTRESCPACKVSATVHRRKERTLSAAMLEVLLHCNEREVQEMGAYSGTIAALSRRELIEPTKFERCYPVPLPTHWRITEKGVQLLMEMKKK